MNHSTSTYFHIGARRYCRVAIFGVFVFVVVVVVVVVAAKFQFHDCILLLIVLIVVVVLIFLRIIEVIMARLQRHVV